MFPIINLFGKELGTYMLMSLVGIFVAGIYICRNAKKRGYNDNDFITLLLISAIGVFIGGHLLFGITYIRGFILLFSDWSKYVNSFKDLIDCLGVLLGGSVFYGGLLGGLLAGFIYCKKKKFNLKDYSDICAPGIPLFHFFGRIGCFLGGCCYGIESDFGYTIHGNELIPMVNDVNRFPVQLMEATFNLGLFILLAYFLKNNKFKGKLLSIYLLIYPIIRFFDEFLRGDTYRGFLFGLSTSQIISIILFISSAIYLIVQQRKIKKQIQ